MDVEQLKQCCKALPGVVEENYAHPSNVLTYKVGRRKFAYSKPANQRSGDLVSASVPLLN